MTQVWASDCKTALIWSSNCYSLSKNSLTLLHLFEQNMIIHISSRLAVTVGIGGDRITSHFQWGKIASLL